MAVPVVRSVWGWALTVLGGVAAILTILTFVGGGGFSQVLGKAEHEKLAGEMMEIRGGTFRMGDLSGVGFVSEVPVHSVTVSSFRMGKKEVTFSQWKKCVEDGSCKNYTPKDKGWGRDSRPVINVSWDDVWVFIAWLNHQEGGGGYRLPKESEWEYAARAGSESLYSWGDDAVVVVDDKSRARANCKDCGDGWDHQTAPVGEFPANALGLQDMHGNVSEWVQDCWNKDYWGVPVDGSAWESGDCNQRVVRGGSWNSDLKDLRSSYRFKHSKSNQSSSVGFRLARDCKPGLFFACARFSFSR